MSSILATKLAQVVEILIYGRQGYVYPTVNTIPAVDLMTHGANCISGHDIDHTIGIFRLQHQIAKLYGVSLNMMDFPIHAYEVARVKCAPTTFSVSITAVFK